MRLTASWQGIEVLDSRIDRLIDMASGPEITEALRPGAELIAQRWRSKVPIYTGQYHDSIRVEHGMADEFDINALNIVADAVNPNDQYPYPLALEFGTSTMPPHPSALPAFDESVDEAVAMAALELDLLILRVAQR